MALPTRPRIVMAATGFLVALPALAWAVPVTDVKVHLVPVVSPGDTDPNIVPPSLDGRYHLDFNWTTDPNYHVEVWVNDLGTTNTGVISAYLDLSWNSGTITNATALHHSAAFDFLTEGAIDDPGAQVINFGGSDGSLLGQGVDEYVRVGRIDFAATAGGIIDFAAVEGAGEISVRNRELDYAEITGCQVSTPEPLSCVLLMLGGAACCRRRCGG